MLDFRDDSNRAKYFVSSSVPLLFDVLKDVLKNRIEDGYDFYQNWNHFISFILFIIKCSHCQTDKKAYDLIVSNPPYVASEEMQAVPEEYRHEPVSALEAPDEGMGIVARILDTAPAYLADGGRLMVEVGYSQAIFERHFPRLEVIWLEQQQGGAGIFVIDKARLLRCKQKR